MNKAKKKQKKTRKIVLTSRTRCDNMKCALLWCHMPIFLYKPIIAYSYKKFKG